MKFQSTPPARGATTPRKFETDCGFHFNPRPPRGGRPNAGISTKADAKFQSTPPARGATSGSRIHFSETKISIHAPREGGDVPEMVLLTPETYFNPRPPRGGRLRLPHPFIHWTVRFQSTPPARGATLLMKLVLYGTIISIHAPREGGDCIYGRSAYQPGYFNPRPPRGGRPRTVIQTIPRNNFNPRPPRGGRLFNRS